MFSVSDSTNSTSYYYDSANQLVRENNQAGNLTKGWTYDNAGNILYSREYPYATGTVGTPEQTNNYTYGDTNWGDKLTAYNGQTITYDAIGNPLSDGTWSYTREHGREMASMSKNSALVITKQPEDCFCELGGTASLTVAATGTVATTYLYDAWGNHLHVTGSLSATVGRYNPLRYRGYVYDRETKLYYLQSRYYNPETGRFINGDAVVSTGQGVLGNNMYVYCLNNPVNFVDRGGNNAEALPWWAGTMWWLNFVDGPLPVGEIVYGAGIVILGVGALIVADDVTTPQVSFEEEKERAEPEPPDVTYPGDDPEKAPEGTQWKGKPGSKEGGREGNYHNPETGESWHPDLEHPEPIGPHWDYRDTHGDWWRIGPKGIITYKDAVRIKEELMHGK